MRIEARKWEGEEWPEKRVSIADAETKFCLFVSARYADIDEAKIQADEICRRVNCHDELVEALASVENDDGRIPPAIWELRNKALAKARGEQ